MNALVANRSAVSMYTKRLGPGISEAFLPNIPSTVSASSTLKIYTTYASYPYQGQYRDPVLGGGRPATVRPENSWRAHAQFPGPAEEDESPLACL